MINRIFAGRAWAAALAMAWVMAGCGGGGDGGTATPTPTPVVIVDSFGQPVAAGDGGIGDGDSGADGTAGEGKPIVGGTVVVTDANGKTVSATTNAQGYYRVKVSGFAAPFVAKVTAPGGKVYHSLNVKPIVVNGFVTVNISGLTDKVASDVAKAGGKASASELTPQIVAANPSAISASIAALRTQLSAVITASGIDVNSFDPIGVPFRADHTGYDKVLDNVVVTVAADGSTQVAVSPTFTGTTPPPANPALAGTWELRMDEGGSSFTVGQFPAAAVPPAEIVTAFSADTFMQQIWAYDVAKGFTLSGGGSTWKLTGAGTDYTIVVNSFSVSGYQSCGACGVGTQVSFTVNSSFTESGLWEGVQHPSTTFNEAFTFRYVRIN